MVVAARAARALGKAGRGALPTAGKREGISFLILAGCYGWRWGCWDREERVEGSGGDERATVPAALQYPRVLFTWWWRWLGLGALGEADRGASPTAGKREGISF